MKFNFWSVFENTLPWAALAWISFYAFCTIFLQPYTGIYIGFVDQGWQVSSVAQNSPFRPGDILIRVGDVSGADAGKDLNTGLFNAIQNGQAVQVDLLRNGHPLKISFTLPGWTRDALLDRLNTQWFLSYIFWLAGLGALLFLRPRGLLRRVFMLFCFLTAAWLSVSTISGLHFMGAALALRALVWLSVPVYLHLHWLFPTPLGRLPGWVWSALYGLCALLALASLLQLLPQNLYLAGFVLALLGSLGLLIAHVIKQPGERRALAGMVTALGIILLPVIVIVGFMFIQPNLNVAPVVVTGIAALPGFYFYTLYLRQLSPVQSARARRLVGAYAILVVGGLLFCLAFGLYALYIVAKTDLSAPILMIPLIPLILLVISLLSFLPFLILPALADERVTVPLGAASFGFSANRAASGLTFLFLEVLLGLALLLLSAPFIPDGLDFFATSAMLLVVGALGLVGYAPFRRAFETRLLAMPLPPENLLSSYAARITTSLELEPLRRLLLDEVMPSLLVRQFAQLEWRAERLTPLFSLGVQPGPFTQADLERAAGYYLPIDRTSALPAWVRLVLPLRAAGTLRGWWLFGQRDPDDRYSAAEIVTLQALADQTALALTNIDQAEVLRALYFEDIERHEAERLHLAVELHDDVLNQLAALNLNLHSAAPEIKESYGQAVAHIREIINGLRPAMLNYGLHPALEALADDLNDRHPDGPQIILDVPRPESAERYPARVELALFRVVQQACANAIQHAACKTIRIQGSLDPQSAALAVLDDGHGFAAGAGLDLPALLAGKHFGLAGMVERAALIGATLSVESQPGQGCRVEIRLSAFSGQLSAKS